MSALVSEASSITKAPDHEPSRATRPPCRQKIYIITSYISQGSLTEILKILADNTIISIVVVVV